MEMMAVNKLRRTVDGFVAALGDEKNAARITPKLVVTLSWSARGWTSECKTTGDRHGTWLRYLVGRETGIPYHGDVSAPEQF